MRREMRWRSEEYSAILSDFQLLIHKKARWDKVRKVFKAARA